jgi:hypothetical protein
LLAFFASPTWAQQACRTVFNLSAVYESENTKVTKVVPGAHGGNLITIKKDKKMWSVWGKTEVIQQAPMGDPRWLHVSLPKEVANFMKIKRFDDEGKELSEFNYFNDTDQMQIPDADEVNGTFKKLDAQLKKTGHDGIPFGFYVENDLATTEIFLKKFVELGRIPMGRTAQLVYHDTVFHILPLMFIKQSWFKESNRKTKITLIFADWIKNFKPELLTSKVDQRILNIRGAEVDLMGNLSPFIYQAKRHGIGQRTKDMGDRGVYSFVGGTSSPFNYLKMHLQDPTRNFPLKASELDQFGEYLHKVSPDLLEENPEIQSLNSNFDLEKYVSQRSAELREAVLKLQER